ncbi:BURP domain protein RD22-like isoform X2 [Prosopis cineraria]|uniref:BURP domain protein RD22-like isoform X2 n=1 Tax=Prosopis cineraria TaxID=364024 RepID=UPI00240ED0AF|nr:BURP domain protein RD22-like isoform X2 [Prosopis cineraria]
MKFLPLLIVVVLVATHAASPPELYWKSMLPATSMPKFITELLHPAVIVGKAGGDTTIHVRHNITFGNQNYAYAAVSDTEFNNIPNTTLFFLEKDMKPGHRMNFQFMQTSNQSFFLPREVVKSVSFSSGNMAQILKEFDVKAGSTEAKVLKETVELCEKPGVKGEEKYCATSLESMVDFITLKLGKNVEAFSTEVNKGTKKQEYTIKQGVKKVGEAKVVVCHKLNYICALFYCHKTETTIAYTVPLVGADGTKVKALSLCHTDTSGWNPKHLAFQVLKVKPGSVPVCHFLSQDNVVWVLCHK